MTERVWNFSAGPATLPVEVLEEAASELVCREGSGMSVMEMSHRSPDWVAIHEETEANLRELLAIPDNYEVLFLQGGASLQFAMIPLNLLGPDESADFVLTGRWSNKAINEAKKLGYSVRVAASSEETDFDRIPESFDLDPNAAYCHITSNNTIFGAEWSEADLPETGEVPIVADASSNILSRPIDVSRYGLIYAGAQKNMGPAGVTIVILRRDLLGSKTDPTPTMLDYRTHAGRDSRFNTPPTWSIYMVGLVLKWLKRQGGLEAVARKNEEKAALIYDLCDGDFYRGTVREKNRSRMNIPFRLPSPELEVAFLKQADERGLKNLKGHRSVGGCRASIYNAMPTEGVRVLADFMKEFRKANG